ncbi:MAG: D-glycero-beta-D-manno-heptose 1-phosphate adenylyltransferase [Pseudobdellovibrionaceae bacterium]
MGQVTRIEKISSDLAILKSQNKKIVFTNGCFDLLHVGHVRYLQEAKRLGDVLVVGVNSDASIRILKGPTRPVQNEADRAEILAALGCVDFTVIFTEETPKNLIETVKPDILVKGGDWKIDQIVGSDFVLANGGKVLSLQFVDGKSTTKLIEKALHQKEAPHSKA